MTIILHGPHQGCNRVINTINKTSPLPARFDVYLKFNTQISSLPSEFDEVSCLEYLNICHRFSLLEALSVEAVGLWLGLDLHDDGIQDGIDVDDCVGVTLGYVADRVGIAVGCFYSLWLLLKGRPESQRSAFLSAHCTSVPLCDAFIEALDAWACSSIHEQGWNGSVSGCLDIVGGGRHGFGRCLLGCLLRLPLLVFGIAGLVSDHFGGKQPVAGVGSRCQWL